MKLSEEHTDNFLVLKDCGRQPLWDKWILPIHCERCNKLSSGGTTLKNLCYNNYSWFLVSILLQKLIRIQNSTVQELLLLHNYSGTFLLVKNNKK